MAAPDEPLDWAWFADAWNNGQWIRAIRNSFFIGICATLLSTALGTLAAIGLGRPEMPYRRAIMSILISPMIVPLVIAAAGMFFFYSQVQLNLSLFRGNRSACRARDPVRDYHCNCNIGRVR